MSNCPFQTFRRTLGTRVLALASLTCLSLVSLNVQAQVVTESPEIVYSGADAQLLRDKATQLGTAVAIYEYVHNTIEHSPYHGSRSGSVNTFLGQRGSDVDIATALIAMLRSQNTPARYAVGTVRVPAAQLTNWLGIPQLDTAVEVLKSQGIQGVTLAGDRSTVDFEHVWAEAFVPFDQYRGINTVSHAVDCSQSANAARCTWVALDASFKQKTYNGLNLDSYNAVTFDYTAYYNAIKNNDATRRDKNPLAILEDQIGSWLRTNYAGKTLEDVEDAGKINELREGLLPASLPYQVVGNTRRYDTMALHDAVVPATEPKKWGKRLTISFYLVAPLDGGGTLTVNLGAGNALLAELNTKRLTLSSEFPPPGNIPNVVTRLGGVEIARPLSGNGTIVGYSWKQAGVDFAVGAGFGGIAAVNAARRGAQIQEGIYVASTTAKQGLPNVGQSGQITTRLEQHVASGKITQEVAGTAKVFEVLGGKTSREVAEQRMTNQMGGVGTGSLANKVNPIGASRSGLLDDPSLGVIPSSNLFNWTGVLGAEAVYQGGITSLSAFGAQPAGGGFLLYPNKPNNNMMQSVYSK